MTDDSKQPNIDELTAEQVSEETRKNLALLEHINVNNILSILYGSIKELHENMTEAQKKGEIKKTQYNKGYMTALADINESIKYLVQENIRYAQETAGTSSDD